MNVFIEQGEAYCLVLVTRGNYPYRPTFGVATPLYSATLSGLTSRHKKYRTIERFLCTRTHMAGLPTQGYCFTLMINRVTVQHDLGTHGLYATVCSSWMPMAHGATVCHSSTVSSEPPLFRFVHWRCVITIVCHVGI